jgi:hypothetical protein
VRTEHIAEQFHQHPKAKTEADEGYRGLANELPGHISAPPKKTNDDAPPSEHHAWRKQQHRQSSARICGEHHARRKQQHRQSCARDPRAGHQRRAQPVAAPAAVHRPPQDLRRDPPRDRSPGL